MFEWALGAVIGIILLGFVGWIPAIVGYLTGCLIAILSGSNDADTTASIGFVGGLLAIIVIGLPISIWLGHEIVIRLL